MRRMLGTALAMAIAMLAVGGRDGEEFRFVATAADIGSWRAHLRIPDGDRPCGPNALFTVTAAPDTATAEPRPASTR